MITTIALVPSRARTDGERVPGSRFDVVVVGSGPAGSVAALTLARRGARVALVDKARFPRDKACGDLVGPRGIGLLDRCGVSLSGGRDVGDMEVVGPTGRRVHLPSAAGLTYPGHGTSLARTDLDHCLYQAAVDAGAVPLTGRVGGPLDGGDRPGGVAMADGTALHADFVIGADGATSNVATRSGLVDPAAVLWGFAVRGYVDQAVAIPSIVLWELRRWHAFPGYGWIFPTADGGANVGLGIATRAWRAGGSEAVRLFPAFLEHLATLGLLRQAIDTPRRRLGGWLKMGMVGTTPAAGRTLLVGDAAGLVNPLQGEGISQAMASGLAAAEAIVDAPGAAAECYRAELLATHLPYQQVAAAAQDALVGRPAAVAAVARAVTAPGVGRAIAGGWAVFWNDLLDGAPPSRARTVAALASGTGRRLTARSPAARWFAGIGVGSAASP